MRSIHGSPLPEFKDIYRYWDKHYAKSGAKILPGEYYVTTSNEIIATVLGSCISVCVYDPINQIGGMNHFMLPTASEQTTGLLSKSFRYGDVAMAKLINDLLSCGSRKEELKFKAFGGARMLQSHTDIGQLNIDFLHKFLALEGLALTTSDLGGKHARKIIFNPMDGKVMLKKLTAHHEHMVHKQESQYKQSIDAVDTLQGEIDLF